MSSKLSFIIPVYNVEQYIDKCVNSILSQATKAVEIILVNDGSTDASGLICDGYADKNAGIIVVHQKNRGHSAARNAGLDIASGEYVVFVDSDDYIDGNCLEVILDYIDRGGADVCFMDAFKVFPDGSTENLGDAIRREYIRGKSRSEVMQYLSSRPKFSGSACTKIFRKSFLQKHGLSFPTDLLHGEDLTLCMEAILAAESFDALDIPYYYYRQNRSGSVTASGGVTAFSDLSSFVRKYADKLAPDHKGRDDVSGYAMAFVAYEYSILLWKYALLPKAEKQKALEFLKNYRWVLRFNPTTKMRCIDRVCSLLGIRITACLLNAYMKHRK